MVTASEIQTRYNQNPSIWDQIDLVYLTLSDKELAVQIKAKLDSGETFEEVYQKFSPTTERPNIIFRRDLIRRNKLKPAIKAEVDIASCQETLGPIQMGEYWCLCNVQNIIPSTLDAQVKQELQESVFSDWMEDKLQQLKIISPEAITSADSTYTESAA
ncbi:MAG: peptidyl-prolyl cis-trans isomerase [Acaryochloridaceae cyanobacterium RL_2_7]|nr:peptidyl-prolyl cis-trans isomerase [Acaryochloridaceae cyanobacterium RL_2_7]